MARNSVASLLGFGAIIVAVVAINYRNGDGIFLALMFLMASCTVAS